VERDEGEREKRGDLSVVEVGVDREGSDREGVERKESDREVVDLDREEIDRLSEASCFISFSNCFFLVIK
jgi:hypothetical protein